jgi:EAL domain-containing protein (putative c-di-GMP-specific phosphodiesterase class I)
MRPDGAARRIHHRGSLPRRRSWPEPITVALNVSPKQIILPNLPNVVSQALARHKLAGNRIELEVTEGVFLDSSSRSLDILAACARWASASRSTISDRLFLDRLSQQGRLPQAEDRRQLRPRRRHPAGQRRHHQVDRAARQGLRMSVTAEGVETAEDFERMRELGCDTIQGYLFGKPLSYDRANQLGPWPRRPQAG